MKRKRMPSIRLRNCYVQMSNVEKRVRATDGSESGFVKKFMPAEDLVKELLYGIGTIKEMEMEDDDRDTDGDTVEHQVNAEDVIVISDEDIGAEDNEDMGFSSFSSTDDFLEDRTWRKSERSQPRVPKSKPTPIVLPSNWQTRSRTEVQEALESQDARLRDVLDDVEEEEEWFPAEQRVPSLPSLPPSASNNRVHQSSASNNRVHLPSNWQNMTLDTFRNATSFTNNNVIGISRIMDNIREPEVDNVVEEVIEEPSETVDKEKSKERKRRKDKKQKKSKYKDKDKTQSPFRKSQTKKRSKKKLKKARKKDGSRIVLSKDWQQKTRAELYAEILSGNPLPPSPNYQQEEEPDYPTPVRKEFIPLLDDETSDLSLHED